MGRTGSGWVIRFDNSNNLNACMINSLFFPIIVLKVKQFEKLYKMTQLKTTR